MKLFIQTMNELKKIIMHPLTYIMLAIMVVAMSFTGIFLKTDKLDYNESKITGDSIVELYDNFYNSNEKTTDSHAFLNSQLENNKLLIEKIQQKSDKDEIVEVKDEFCDSFYLLYRELYDDTTTDKPLIDLMYDLYLKTIKFQEYMENYKKLDTLKSSLLIKDDEYKTITNLLKNVKKNLPKQSEYSTLKDNNSVNKIKAYADAVVHNYYKSVKEVDEMVNDLSIYEINPAYAIKLNDDYYLNVKSKLENIDTEIDLLYNSSTEKNDEEIKEKIEILIWNYKLQVNSAIDCLKAQLLIDMEDQFGTKSMNKYLNYSDFNAYELKQTVAISDYYLTEKNIYQDRYLAPLNFGQSSNKVTAYDFAYHLFTIALFVIIIYIIAYVLYTFAFEKFSGKTEMFVSTSLTKTQIYFSKILALIIVSLLLVFAVSVISIILGLCIYGSPEACILAITPGGKIRILSSFRFIIEKILLSTLTIIMWLSIATTVSILIKNFYKACGVIAFIYVLALVGNSLLMPYLIWQLFPFAHFDLSIFIGGATLDSGFLVTSIYKGANIIVSYLYFFILLIALNILNYFMFKGNDQNQTKPKKVKKVKSSESVVQSEDYVLPQEETTETNPESTDYTPY